MTGNLTRNDEAEANWKHVSVSQRNVIVHKEFKHPFIRGKRLFMSPCGTMLIEFWDHLQAIYSVSDNGFTARIIQEKNTFSSVTTPVYFSPDFKTYFKSGRCPLGKLILLVYRFLKNNEKPEKLVKHYAPPCYKILCASKQDNPLIYFENCHRITYINLNSVQQTVPLEKDPAVYPHEIDEKFLPPDQLKRKI